QPQQVTTARSVTQAATRLTGLAKIGLEEAMSAAMNLAGLRPPPSVLAEHHLAVVVPVGKGRIDCRRGETGGPGECPETDELHGRVQNEDSDYAEDKEREALLPHSLEQVVKRTEQEREDVEHRNGLAVLRRQVLEERQTGPAGPVHRLEFSFPRVGDRQAVDIGHQFGIDVGL